MQVTEVTANQNGLFDCPSCNAINGAQALGQHGIDYIGPKTPDNERLAFCTSCGYAMQVNYPAGAQLPRNASFRWEYCEECGGDFKHHNGNDPCDKCEEGGFWVETTESPVAAETATQEP